MGITPVGVSLDAMAQLHGLTPSGRGEHKMGYDGAGRMTSFTSPAPETGASPLTLGWDYCARSATAARAGYREEALLPPRDRRPRRAVALCHAPPAVSWGAPEHPDIVAARVIVGMSGGVDSSVAALALLRQGCEVVGVTLHLWDYAKEGHAGRCCAPEDQYDAARVCASLGIAHYTFDRRALFREAVVDRFVRDYVEGRTPSPCVRCNESVKLGPLLAIARSLGATRIATGHYARITPDGEGVALRVAAEAARDQSYFLWAAPLEALRALTLPLGAMHKDEARRMAAEAGLRVASKPDSTDLCFVEGDDYTSFVASRATTLGPPGTLETVDGRVVGTHQGVHAFTPGQRRGVGAAGVPRYVLRIIHERAAVIVGTAEESLSDTVRVEALRWLTEAPTTEGLRVKIRYRHPGVDVAAMHVEGDVATLRLAEAQRGVAPGQAAVLYQGDRVVAGGWIA